MHQETQGLFLSKWEKCLIVGECFKVEMKIWMALIYKALFPSISMFETPPSSFLCNPVRPCTSAMALSWWWHRAVSF